ncbi:MAG: GIY-YIG nuclease family protein [Candidatus Poribacteria bacterium]|nr:GIY-YIG nuclease family protein [Candidatus Poribacteria bacterium]
MNTSEKLGIKIARPLILERFTGQPRVPTRAIINHVEKEHCKGVRELSANEKMIVSDALISLRKEGLADNPERGYWSFLTTTESEDPKMIEKPQRQVATSGVENIAPERTIGSGKGSVYLYYYPKYQESAESKGKKVWECKIGKTIHGKPQARIGEQTTGLPESPKIGLHIKTDRYEKIERILHDILKVRGRYVDGAPGKEWFLTSPSEVEEIYKSIGESSCENTLDG